MRSTPSRRTSTLTVSAAVAGLLLHGLRPLVVGANHRSSSLALRDRLFVEDGQVAEFLDGLRRHGLVEALVLSTCDRIEVQALHEEPAAAGERILESLARHAEVERLSLEGQFYVAADEHAVRHIFRVAASLDSMVVGEPQVFGQVKASHRLAAAAGMTGSGLEAVMQAAYAAAKRVRTETTIGERPVSIAAAAVGLARDLLGDLSRATGLLLGAGDMGELAARELLAGGLGGLVVADPVARRADALARRLDCHAADMATLASLMASADVVVASLGGRHFSITADMVRTGLAARRHRPQFIIDAGVPGDVDPATNRLDDAFLYDLGDLERIAHAGIAGREAEAAKAEAIIDEEVEAFVSARASRDAAPAVSALRGHVESLAHTALMEAGGDAEKAIRLLTGRLLHHPSAALRNAAAEGRDWPGLARAVETLFALGPDNSGGGGNNDDKE